MKLEQEVMAIASEHLKMEHPQEYSSLTIQVTLRDKLEGADIEHARQLHSLFPDFGWKDFEPFYEVCYSYFSEKHKISGIFGVHAVSGAILKAPKYA